MKVKNYYLIIFLPIFALFFSIYVYALYFQLPVKTLLRIILFSFFTLFIILNPIKSYIYLLPFTLITSAQIWFNYNVKPHFLKLALPQIQFSLKIFDFFIPIFMFILILLKLSGGIKLSDERKPPLLNYFFMFYLWVLLSALWSQEKDFSLLYSFLLIINFMYFYIGYIYINKEKEFWIFLLCWGVFLVFNVFVAVSQKIWGGVPFLKLWEVRGVSEIWTTRVRGIFTHANSLSAFMSLSITLMIGFLLYKKTHPYIKKIMYILIPLCALSIALSYSRTGYLSLVIISYLFLMYYFLLQKKIKKFIYYSFLTLILIGLTLLLLQKLFPDILLRISSITWGKRDISTVTRIIFWKEAVKLFLKNPLTGIGIGQFAFTKVSGAHLHAHNVYFNILAELGIIGIMIFIKILYEIYKLIIHYYKQCTDSTKHLIASVGIGWIIVLFQFSFDYFWLNQFPNTESKIFFLWILTSFLIPKIFIKNKCSKTKVS